MGKGSGGSRGSAPSSNVNSVRDYVGSVANEVAKSITTGAVGNLINKTLQDAVDNIRQQSNGNLNTYGETNTYDQNIDRAMNQAQSKMYEEAEYLDRRGDEIGGRAGRTHHTAADELRSAALSIDNMKRGEQREKYYAALGKLQEDYMKKNKW